VSVRPTCLLIARNVPPVIGGSAVVYDRLAAHAGGRILVLSARNDVESGRPLPGWAETDAARPYPVERIAWLRPPESRAPPSPLRALARDYATRLAVAAAVLRLCLRHRIRVVCVGELISLGWIATALRRVPGMRSICFVHGEEITTEFGYRRFARHRARALADADAVVAVSSFTRDRIVARMGTDPAKIEVINNGVDLDRFRPVPRRDDLVRRLGLGGGPVLLTVSRLMEKKGIDTVLRALVDVAPAHPGVRYLVVGEGEDRARLEALARDLGVAGLVAFAGAVQADELSDYYALCDVFIMPNRRMPDGDTEGFGLVFLEANACRRPVIGGRDGGVVDAVVDGETGLLVDGADPAAVRGALLRLLGDPVLRERLAEAGYRRALASGWASRAAQFMVLVERLRGGGR
jgi:phosphatidylinositol alpha-1,6-mannosyltransferase